MTAEKKRVRAERERRRDPERERKRVRQEDDWRWREADSQCVREILEGFLEFLLTGMFSYVLSHYIREAVKSKHWL